MMENPSMEAASNAVPEHGPVELVVLEFEGERADEAVVAAILDVVSKGYVTVLDLVFVTRTDDSHVRITDADENLDAIGLGGLPLVAQALISEHDVDLVRDALEPGTSAAIIVYEETWARRVATALRAAGGTVMMQLPLPTETIDAAISAAITAE